MKHFTPWSCSSLIPWGAAHKLKWPGSKVLGLGKRSRLDVRQHQKRTWMSKSKTANEACTWCKGYIYCNSRITKGNIVCYIPWPLYMLFPHCFWLIQRLDLGYHHRFLDRHFTDGEEKGLGKSIARLHHLHCETLCMTFSCGWCRHLSRISGFPESTLVLLQNHARIMENHIVCSSAGFGLLLAKISQTPLQEHNIDK